MSENNLLLAYYGDDFTGSTDALEFLSRAGIKTVLFMEPPTPAQLARYEGLQAVGVAGLTRSMPPDEMEQVLLPAFAALKALGAPHVHYKVCSTFDSSPQIGSIGRAADVGASVFQAAFIPLLVAAPALGRYCLFGNLFARMGIGTQGQIYRLDRHPSMSRHPVTPADESDLRLHLSKQTQKKVGLLDILQISQLIEQAQQTLEKTIADGADIVLFDGLSQEHLLQVGQLIDAYASSNRPLFSIGSSGIEMALGGYWEILDKVTPASVWRNTGKVEAILVVSGSCSPVTAKQIEAALANGFAGIAIDTTALVAGADIETLLAPYIQQASAYIQQGRSVIVHTSIGGDDSRIMAAHQQLLNKGLNEQAIRTQSAQLLGTALGRVADGVISQTKLRRLVIAGGDTSSYAARALGIEAVEMIAPVTPGAPLCKAYAPGKPVDGLEVNIKGGQVGDENYFLTVLKGKPL
ncbi:four-carbon acid sugar kinase family protein [Mucilaginibacter sp. PAMB04168]|uniref:four-carbon acid sugar kinase family protein n=1 Tax=Mucilaginibacter sp. PAMB04168 TaxID=3138567 RepID=UPI0031F60BFF